MGKLQMLIIAAILLTIYFTLEGFKSKRHRYDVDYKWIHAPTFDHPYKYHEEGGFLTDSTEIIIRGKDTLILTIRDHD